MDFGLTGSISEHYYVPELKHRKILRKICEKKLLVDGAASLLAQPKAYRTGKRCVRELETMKSRSFPNNSKCSGFGVGLESMT